VRPNAGPVCDSMTNKFYVELCKVKCPDDVNAATTGGKTTGVAEPVSRAEGTPTNDTGTTPIMRGVLRIQSEQYGSVVNRKLAGTDCKVARSKRIYETLLNVITWSTRETMAT